MPPYERRLSRKERKLERKRREIEKKRLTFLEYLNREIKYGNIIRRRYEKRWKEILTKLALEKSRSDLENTWQACDWSLDVKDFIISTHMDELKKARDQSVLALESHNARIEMIISQYKDVLNSIHMDYLKELENLKAFYKAQDEEYANASEDEQRVIRCMLFQIERVDAKVLRNQMTRHFMFIESRTNDATIATNHLEANFDKKIRKLFAKCNESFDKYLGACKQKMNEYQKFREAYDASTASNHCNLKRIVHLVYVQKILQTKLEMLYDNYGQELENVTDKLEKVRKILSTLVNKISGDIESDDTHIKLIVSRSLATLNYLNGIARKGELLLKLMWCGKKYETLHEKVGPYPAGKIDKKDPGHLGVKLFLFHVRMANVDNSRVALNEERKVLQLEKMILTKKLAKYCSGYQKCPYGNTKNRTIGNQQRTHGNSFYPCSLLDREYITQD